MGAFVDGNIFRREKSTFISDDYKKSYSSDEGGVACKAVVDAGEDGIGVCVGFYD